MKTMMSSSFTATILLGLFSWGACTSPEQHGEERVKIVPEPVSVVQEAGTYALDARTRISAPDDLIGTARLFADQIGGMVSIKPEVVAGEAKGIMLKIDENMEGEEAYHLDVCKDGVTIAGRTEKGIFYGTQTFLQLLPTDGKPRVSVGVPLVVIHDYPRFKWRGIHLDESRHFFGADFVKGLIDQMARLKMNVFHWHLVDDQGFRIEIKKYPRLTEIGAWRLDNENGVWNYSVVQPREGDPKYGGFYTREEIREVVAFAAARQVTIVPEVEMPGHATALIWAYPELSCSGEPWSLEAGAGFEFSDPLCAGNERTFEILEGILSEVIDLFPSYYIHIGGDECKKAPWRACPKCQQRMKEENLDNVHELQSYFIKRIAEFVRSKDRAIIGWDEILEGGLAPGAAVMSWRGFSGGVQAAEMGHEVVMTPTSYCYFDYYQGNSLYEPKAIGGYTPLSKVYEFDPVPGELSADKHQLILGGQANIWTEHIFTPEHCEYMIFPRAFAMAEVLWTPKEKHDYDDFLERVIPRYKALASMGVNFRVPLAEGLTGDKVFFRNDTLITLFNPYADGATRIHYTLDGTMPDEHAPVYEDPIPIAETSCLKSRIYHGEGVSNVAVTWFFKFDPEINGLHCDYYEGQWTSLPDFDRLSPLDHYQVRDIQAAPRSGAADHYGFRLTGYLDIAASGEYEFFTSSDDGSRLMIDGEVVVDYDGTHGADIRTGKIRLDRGKHAIEILFFEATGGEYLEAGFLTRDGMRKPFYPSELYLEQD